MIPLRTFVLVVFVLIVAGVCWYLVGMAPFIPAPFTQIIRWVILAGAVLWACFEVYKLIKKAPA